MSEMVTFVIPSYNCATFLPHAVKSVLLQTYKDIEVVIVNDASTDRTDQYLKWASQDNRIRVINNPENKGRSESRNIGNSAAHGKYIFVLDADDVAAPRRVELCIKRLERFQFVHGSGQVIDCCGRILGDMPTEVFRKDRAIRTAMTGIFHSSVAYTKDFAMKYPYLGGDVCRLGIDDWNQQMRAAMDGVKFEYVPLPLAYYRQWEGGISKTRKKEDVDKAKQDILTQMGATVGAL